MVVELPVVPSTPPVYAPVKNLMLYVAMGCPLACSYCFVPKHPERMSQETARQAVDFALDRAISGLESSVEITYFGGEPFLNLEVMEDLATYVRRPRPNCYKQVTFGATTSGVLAGPRVERVIRESRMALLISLDGGPEASSPRPLVNGRPSYPEVARHLPRLVSWAREATVRMTYHPQALDLLANVKHALELGAPAVALCPVLEADWSGHEERLEHAYQELAAWFVSEFGAGRVPPLLLTWNLLRDWCLPGCCGGGRPQRPCPVGHGILAVDVLGHVHPCHRHMEPGYRLGHVSRPELGTQRQGYAQLSSRDIRGCEGCVAERVCGGGCRAATVSAGYGPLGKHPHHCLVTRAHARAVQGIAEALRGDPRFWMVLRQGPSASTVLTELASTGG